MFADTRARDGAAGVVREDAGADDGGIADASPLLIHKAASRRGGSQIAGSVARDSANRAELALVCLQMIENNRLLFPIQEVVNLVGAWGQVGPEKSYPACPCGCVVRHLVRLLSCVGGRVTPRWT